MAKYVLRKVLIALATVFVLATATFFMMKLIPGDPFASLTTKVEVQEKQRAYYGLDKPVFEQYMTYMGNLLHGNLGYSLKKTGRTVVDIIREAFPVSARLGLVSFIFAELIGYLFGILCAQFRGRWPDYVLMLFAVLGIAIKVTEQPLIAAHGFSVIDSTVYSVAIAIGFTLAIVIFAGLREQMEQMDPTDFVALGGQQAKVDEAEAAAKQIAPRDAREMALLEQLSGYVELSRKIIAQDKSTPGKDKVYSVHEPQVECIAKGKVHKRYEFGVKAGFVTASRTNWILGAMALPGNPYDGNTLSKVLKQAEEICGVKPRHAYCDLGYRGHDCKGECDVQVVNRFRKRKPRALLRWWKRRSAVEPVIGHVKSDHYMERNMLGGERGDKLNAMLSAAGFNLVKLMKGLKKRRLKRLFLCLRTEAGNIADAAVVLLRWLSTVRRQAAASCRPALAAKWLFA